VICHLSTWSRFAYETSPNQGPIGKRGIFSFCFHFEDNRVWDERVTVSLENSLTDYRKFLEAWNLIEQALQ
jgi:hypothetical protein